MKPSIGRQENLQKVPWHPRAPCSRVPSSKSKEETCTTSPYKLCNKCTYIIIICGETVGERGGQHIEIDHL